MSQLNSEPMPRGMPRPLQDGMPVPYTSDHHHGSDGVHYSIAAVNATRAHECTSNQLCMLCGEDLTERSAVIAVYGDAYEETPLPKTPQNRHVLERGGFHERCAKMTMRHCPHLRDDSYNQQPEIWVGRTATFTVNGRVPKGWRRMKTTAARRAARTNTLLAA